MSNENKPFHEGIENVESKIIDTNNSSIMKISVVAKDQTYRIESLEILDSTQNIVVKTHGNYELVPNCVAILKMSKISGDSEITKERNDFDGSSRNEMSHIALIDREAGDEIVPLPTDTAGTVNHNPRHFVRDPLGVSPNS